MKTKFFLRPFFVLVCCFILHFASLTAQTLQKRSAKIIDSGDLYSTIDFNNNEKDLAELKKQVPAKEVQAILANCTESSWIEGIATLEARNKNRSRMADYVVYEVANVNGQHVLLVPASENQGMPKDMRPNRDFYMVIGSNGVKVSDMMASSNPQKVEEPTDDIDDDLLSVFISDPMDLFAIIKMVDDDDAKKVFIPKIGEDVFNQLSILANEGSWPSGINSFTARTRNRDKFKDYHLYYIADFGDKSVVYAPESENQQMPEDMRPLTEDGIFFVFKSSALSVIDPKNHKEAQAIPSTYTSGDFESELNALMLAMKGDFASIKGDLIPEKEDAMLAFLDKKYQCKVTLEGAESVTVRQGSWGNNTYIFADYGEFRDSVQAENIYKQLVEKIGKMHFSVGTMVQSEQNLDNLMVTYWLPFDISGTMDKAYEKITLEVQLLKTLGFDKDFKTYRESSVYIKVYKMSK